MGISPDIMSRLKAAYQEPTEDVPEPAKTTGALADRLKKPRNQPKKQISVYITQRMEDQLTDLKKDTGWSIAALVEMLLGEALGP